MSCIKGLDSGSSAKPEIRKRFNARSTITSKLFAGSAIRFPLFPSLLSRPRRDFRRSGFQSFSAACGPQTIIASEVIMNVNRRAFVLGSAVAAHAAYGQSEPPVGTASIGVGNRGSFLLRGVLQQPNAKVIAVCDIKSDRLDKAATAAAKDKPATYADWRRVIERKDVDAVFIATPPYL